MEDPTDSVLSMDLSLNLSPPSPSPNLGLSLGLSSTPSAAEEEENEEEEEEEEEEDEEEEESARSFMPDLMWPRVHPLCPSYAHSYLSTSRRTAVRESRGGEMPMSGSEEGERGSHPRVRCRLRRLTSILEESSASAMPSPRPRHTFSPPPSPPAVPLPFPSCGFCSGDPRLNGTASHSPKEIDDGDCGMEQETGRKGEGKELTQNANFECNICLELASEPVVTMCGHLFCWPCLYQWLHLYSTCKECPVCKGVVTDKNVTPIYGRGVNPSPNSPTRALEEEEEGKEALPPRPRARRVESWRQRERERDRERIGVASLTRRVEEIIRFRSSRRLLPRSSTNQNENRPNGSNESSPDHMLSRLRATRNSQRRETTNNFGQRLGLRDRLFTRRFRGRSPPSLATRAPAEEEEEGPVFGDLAFDRMAAIRARLASMEGMLETFAGLNPPITANPDLAASAASPPVLVIPAPMNPWADDGRLSASASASAALIDPGFLREDTAVSEAESSSLLFSRRRDAQSASGGASGSSDVEAGFLRRRKIQRL